MRIQVYGGVRKLLKTYVQYIHGLCWCYQFFIIFFSYPNVAQLLFLTCFAIRYASSRNMFYTAFKILGCNHQFMLMFPHFNYKSILMLTSQIE